MRNKVNSAFFSTVLLGAASFMLEFIDGLDGSFIFVMIFAAIGNFLYGIPVSFLSDLLSKKLIRYRFIVAAGIHILFGFLTIFLLGEAFIFAVICSILFFLTEEWQRQEMGSSKIPFRSIALNGLGFIGLSALAIWGGPPLLDMLEEKTHNYYVIPKGYVGKVYVVYNVSHAPKPEKIEEYDVININQKGYGITSLPVKEGVTVDKYFYIDVKGNKEEINPACIEGGGMEGTMGEGYDYTSHTFYVSNECSGEFFNEDGHSFSNEMTLDDVLIEEGLIDIE